MRTIRSALLLALVAGAAFAAPGGATATRGDDSPTASATQSGAEITVADRCYREKTKLPVRGRGFTPNTAVDVGFASRRPVTRTTDGSGRFTAKVPIPDLGDDPVPGRVRVFAIERGNEANSDSARVQLTPIAVGTRETSFVERGEKIWVRFSGFPNGRVIWGHYFFDSKLRGKQRFGKADGPCGMLRAHVAFIPSWIDRAGVWMIQFDSRKKYSRKAKPRLRQKIRVVSIPARGARVRP